MVSGPATNTIAGIELVETLSEVPAVNLLEPSSRDKLKEMFEKSLEVVFP